MTFEDDFVQLHFVVGPRRIPLASLGLEWPPPERLFLDDVHSASGHAFREARDDDDQAFIMTRVSMSSITDEQRATLSRVARGATYRYEVESNGAR